MKHVELLSEQVLEKLLEGLRPVLLGDPPVKVPPITARRKSGAGMVRARPRVYSLPKMTWLGEYFGQFEAAWIIVRSPQAIFSSVTVALPNIGGFRTATDYCAINQLIEQEAMQMPRLEELERMLEGWWRSARLT